MSENKPDLMEELAEVVRLSERATPGPWIVDDYGDVTANAEDVARIATYEPEADYDAALVAAAVNFIRTRHADISALLMDAVPEYELAALLPGVHYMNPPDGGDVPVIEQLRRMAKDAESWRLVTSRHAMPDGTVAECHVNVGVNVWRGEEWLAFHQCKPEQLRQIVDEATNNITPEG